MLTAPLFVELLRTRPHWLVWAAALAQAVLWVLAPTLFYSAPPGQLPEVLAIGHEFQFGAYAGPPLAFWLGEIVFRIGGVFGVYLLSQACVVVTYWAVFALGRRIVGPSHAAIAVLLMVGVFAFTAPTPEFGPGILAMPLWALALLHYWQAAGEGQRLYWFPLGFEIGLLLLTTYAGLVLLGLLIAFTVATPRCRAQLGSIEPWVAGIIVVLVLFPHLTWLDQASSLSIATPAVIDQNLRVWARLLAGLIAGHVGLAILAVLAWGLPFWQPRAAPEIERPLVDQEARGFVYFFALAPTLALAPLAIFTSRPETFVAGPLVVLSGLAMVVASGDRIRFVHHRLASFAWAGLLLLPPLFVAATMVLSPWTFGGDRQVAQPAGEMGRFFGESFARRTGRPLAIVAGDERTAALVALAAPSRPSLLLDATPERSPWVSLRDVEEKGAIIIWPATDARGAPPAAIRERFPDLVPEVPPRAFERRFQGRLPLLRIGWAVIRPRTQASAPR